MTRYYLQFSDYVMKVKKYPKYGYVDTHSQYPIRAIGPDLAVNAESIFFISGNLKIYIKNRSTTRNWDLIDSPEMTILLLSSQALQ